MWTGHFFVKKDILIKTLLTIQKAPNRAFSTCHVEHINGSSSIGLKIHSTHYETNLFSHGLCTVTRIHQSWNRGQKRGSERSNMTLFTSPEMTASEKIGFEPSTPFTKGQFSSPIALSCPWKVSVFIILRVSKLILGSLMVRILVTTRQPLWLFPRACELVSFFSFQTLEINCNPSIFKICSFAGQVPRGPHREAVHRRVQWCQEEDGRENTSEDDFRPKLPQAGLSQAQGKLATRF